MTEVMIFPTDQGNGWSMVIDGTDVSRFVSRYVLEMDANGKPTLTLYVPVKLVRAGLPDAILQSALVPNTDSDCVDPRSPNLPPIGDPGTAVTAVR